MFALALSTAEQLFKERKMVKDEKKSTKNKMAIK